MFLSVLLLAPLISPFRIGQMRLAIVQNNEGIFKIYLSKVGKMMGGRVIKGDPLVSQT